MEYQSERDTPEIEFVLSNLHIEDIKIAYICKCLYQLSVIWLLLKIHTTHTDMWSSVIVFGRLYFEVHTFAIDPVVTEGDEMHCRIQLRVLVRQSTRLGHLGRTWQFVEQHLGGDWWHFTQVHKNPTTEK